MTNHIYIVQSSHPTAGGDTRAKSVPYMLKLILRALAKQSLKLYYPQPTVKSKYIPLCLQSLDISV